MNAQASHIPVMQMRNAMTRMDHSIVPAGQVTLVMEQFVKVRNKGI